MLRIRVHFAVILKERIATEESRAHKPSSYAGGFKLRRAQ